MAQTDHVRSPGFRPDIEGLRGIAVLLVVAYHSRILPVPGGFVGVDVFFVLSGYLITGILVREIEQTGRVAALRFYGRRMLRLLPAAVFVLMFTLVAERLVYSPVERIELSVSGVATALYASNMYFMAHATDYFAAGATLDPLLHTWSLGVEEQFYFVWPALIICGWQVTRSRGRLAIVLAALAAISFGGEVWLTHWRQPWAFFAMPARAWEFALGGIVGICEVALRARIVAALGWLGLAVVLAAGIGLRGGATYPGVAVVFPVFGTLALLVAGSQAVQGAPRLLAIAPLRWIGSRSYSWYLWHWPVLIVGTAVLGRPGLAARVALVVLSLAAAALTTTFIENPIRFRRRLLARPAFTVAAGVAVSACAATAALGTEHVARSRAGPYAAAAHDASASDSAGCDAGFSESAVRECRFGDTTSATRVVLMGDSHAAQWFAALDSVARMRRWEVVTMLKYSCPVADVRVYNNVLSREYSECDTWRRNALERVNAMRPAAVFIGQYPRAQFTYDANRARIRLDPVRWEAAQRVVLEQFAAMHVPAVLFRDSPTMTHRIPECLSRATEAGRPPSVCAADRERALDTRFLQADERAARGLSSVAFVDLSDALCGPTVCDAVRDGLVIYRDGNHLTATYARHLAPMLDRHLAQVLPRLGFLQPGS